MINSVTKNMTFKNFVVPCQIMVKCRVRKCKQKRNSVTSRTLAALVISVSMLSATIMLSNMTNNSFAQGSNSTPSSYMILF